MPPFCSVVGGGGGGGGGLVILFSDICLTYLLSAVKYSRILIVTAM